MSRSLSHATLRDQETEVRDNIHNAVAEIQREVHSGSIAMARQGLPVSGDAITRYWRPIRRARLAAGIAVPA